MYEEEKGETNMATSTCQRRGKKQANTIMRA
jgi:hypothetical protein